LIFISDLAGNKGYTHELQNTILKIL